MFAHGWEITINLLAAWAAGSMIGMERSFNGRAAGFRTHALVGLAAAATMVITFEPLVLPGVMPGVIGRLDPTRLGQGVMAGVGFIGAGVIFKEGVSVQGLTSAACIWITSAIGMLFGLGLHFGGAMATAGTLITLVLFRWVESFMTHHVYAVAVFRFRADQVPTEQMLHDLLGEHDVELTDTSYKLGGGGAVFEYHGAVRTRKTSGLRNLSARLRQFPGLIEYQLDRVSK